MTTALDTIIDKIEHDETNFTFEDLLVILNLLKEDAILNRFLKDRATEGSISIMDGYEDLAIAIQDVYPEYDSDLVECVQGMIQNTSCLASIIVEDVRDEQSQEVVYFKTDHALLRRLLNEGIEVSVTFDALSDQPGEGMFATVQYAMENFVLEV